MHRHVIRTVGLGLILIAIGAPAAAQALPSAPRLEVGGGASLATATNGESFGAVPFVDGFAGVRLSRRLGLEGYVHLRPRLDAGGASGFYRAQVTFRPDRGKGRRYIGLGLAGAFDWDTWPEYRWTDSQGTTYVEPGGRHFDITPPVVPIICVGYDRELTSHLRVRAELAATAIPDDEFMAILVPSLTVTIPIGRRTTR